jgi:transcriptional regulator with XRE-family HTH domain
MGIITQLREAIKKDGRSLNSLARDAGLSAIQLSRFARDVRGLTTPAVDALCEVLGLELRPKRQRKAK